MKGEITARLVPCVICEHWETCALRSEIRDYLVKFEEKKKISIDVIKFHCKAFKEDKS